MNVDLIRPIGIRILAAAVLGLGALGSGPAVAQSLYDALALAYLNNPVLLAQRASLRATDERVPQALSGWRPTVVATGSLGVEYSSATPVVIAPGSGTSFASGVGITVRQPLFRGFRTTAETQQADNLVRAGRADLVSTEQKVLADSVTAYLNVLRDQAILEINIKNEQVLRRELEATRDRFEVGEVTRTDVAQAESRVARSLADRVAAEGDLESSRADYVQVIGAAPGKLELPVPYAELPDDLFQAKALAVTNNPLVMAALAREAAARDTVDLVTGELLPSVSLDGSYFYTDNPSFARTSSETGSIGAVVTVPIYQAGAVTSRVRESKQIVSLRRMEIVDSKRFAVEQTTQAWEGLQTSRAQVVAFREETRSARIALEGVQEESQAGLRTVLDVLDAEQEHLDARVNLVIARRDEVVASYLLLATLGNLTALVLQLDVPIYDPVAHYQSVRGLLWGLGKEPAPTPIE